MVLNVGVLATSGVVSVAAALVLYVVAATRARSVVLPGSPDAPHNLRVLLIRMRAAGLVCGAVAAFYCLLATSSGAAAEAVQFVVALGCLVIPVLASRRPVLAAYARVRGIPARALRPSPRLALYYLAVVVVLGWPMTVALAAGHGLAVRTVILVAGCLVAGPVLLGLLAPVFAWARRARPLPPDVEQRLLALAGRTGVATPVRGRLVETSSRKQANAWQVGWLPGLRYVLVSDYLLAGSAAAHTEAVLAHELGHVRNHDVRARTFSACLLVAVGSLLITVSVLGLAVALVLVAVSVRLIKARAIPREFAADDVAVAACGPQVLAAALARLAELNAIKLDTSRRWDITVAHPGMAQRLARLQPPAAAAGGVPPAVQSAP